jgi:hypothetical protein
VHVFSTAHPYAQTSVNFNILVIKYKEYLLCTLSFEITVLLLRTLRFPEIRTCDTADELRWLVRVY